MTATPGNRALFPALMALVVLAPLPFAAQRPWAWTFLATLTGVLLVIWAGLGWVGWARAPISARRLGPILVPFALTMAWATIQTQSWVPTSWHHPLWSEAAPVLGTAGFGAISADPTLTWTAILRCMTFGAVFWLAVQLGRHRGRARQAVMLIALSTTAQAVYALILSAIGSETIWWFDKWAYRGDMTGSFVNRNAFGAYLGIGVLCCLGLAIDRLPRPGDTQPRLRARAWTEALLLRALPWVGMASLLILALLGSHSRGALMATLLAIPVLIALSTLGRLVRRGMALLLLALGLVLGGLLLVQEGEVTLRRIAETSDFADDRGQLYRLTLDAIADAPWTGHGFGAFAASFRPYRDLTLPRPVVYDFAHSIPLELAMDLGIPAALLYGLALLAVLIRCVRGVIDRRRDQLYPVLAIAVAILLAVHGLTDFSAQMPAIAVTLALLLGIGYAQSWPSARLTADDGADG